VTRAASYDASLSPVCIDPRVNRTRSPVLPAAARGRDFERRFDHFTLFNDLFWDARGESILAIGPHIPGHLDAETAVQFHCLETGLRLEADYLPSTYHLHGDMYRIMPRPQTSALRVTLGDQQVIVAVQPNISPLFAGRRVLTTRCQNDPFEWLVDWASFHAKEFGFDAVLHYDNLSTAYGPEDARFALSLVPGIEVVVVLSWPFPMEPAHAPIPDTGQLLWQRQLKDRWAESCRLEHQRRRFLEQAELVLIADVDELIIRRNPHASIDDLFAAPDVAWVKFESELVVNTRPLPDRLMRHRDLHWIWNNQGFKTPKYMVKPDRCPDDARWWLHDVSSVRGRDIPPDDFTVAHFFALTTGRDGKDFRSLPHTPTPGVHYEDRQLRETLDRVFGASEADLSIVAPLPQDNPHLLRREAYTLLRAGDRVNALDRLNRAIAVAPYHPMQHQVRRELMETEIPPGS
jgi:hypothetical protein